MLCCYLDANSGEKRIIKYGNNNIKSIEYVDENEKLTGEKKNYTYAGEMESIEHYKNGKKQDEQILFFIEREIQPNDLMSFPINLATFQ